MEISTGLFKDSAFWTPDKADPKCYHVCDCPHCEGHYPVTPDRLRINYHPGHNAFRLRADYTCPQCNFVGTSLENRLSLPLPRVILDGVCDCGWYCAINLAGTPLDRIEIDSDPNFTSGD